MRKLSSPALRMIFKRIVQKGYSHRLTGSIRQGRGLVRERVRVRLGRLGQSSHSGSPVTDQEHRSHHRAMKKVFKGNRECRVVAPVTRLPLISGHAEPPTLRVGRKINTAWLIYFCAASGSTQTMRNTGA